MVAIGRCRSQCPECGLPCGKKALSHDIHSHAFVSERPSGNPRPFTLTVAHQWAMKAESIETIPDSRWSVKPEVK